MKRLLALALVAAAPWAMAQMSPVGLWKTIDDDSGKEKAQVRVVEVGGVVSGKIVKVFDPAEQDKLCEKCSDARKGQRVLGMTIIEGVSRNEEAGMWEGGSILDPNNGKTYRVSLLPQDGGKTLRVRGYIGPFFRTQTWVRVE